MKVMHLILLKKYTSYSALFIMCALCLGLFTPSAYAAPTGNSICTDTSGQNVQGFTVAIVYCVRATITDALTGSSISGIINMQPGYLQQVEAFLNPFKWAAITLAFTLYGVKLATLSVEQLMKESSFLLFRAVMVLYLVTSLTDPAFYKSVNGNGIYGATLDFMGELVSFVSAGFTKFKLSCNNLPPLPAGVDPAEYSVWQACDCMFQTMIGAATNPAVIGTTIIVVLGAAIFSGSLAIAAVLIAITLFVMAIFSLMRAIYAFILCYFIIALLMVVAPLLIPMLVFDNRVTRELFWNWTKTITTTIFQPMLIAGFLSFVIMCEDQFVNGSLPGCNVAAGTGACSIKQLMDACANLSCIEKAPIINFSFNIQNPDLHCDWWNLFCDVAQWGANLITMFVNWALDVLEQVLNWLGNLLFSVPKIKLNYAKILFISLTAFMIITATFRKLLDIMPDMARHITGSAGIALMQMAQVPLESLVTNAVKAGGQAMKMAAGDMKAAGKGSGLGSMASMPGAVGEGMKGAGKSIMRSLIK